VVAVAPPVKMRTVMFGGKSVTVHVVHTLADFAGMLVTSQISAGEAVAGRALAIAAPTTQNAKATIATIIPRMTNLRPRENSRAPRNGPTTRPLASRRIAELLADAAGRVWEVSRRSSVPGTRRW
jgi:hypothetical protein